MAARIYKAHYEETLLTMDPATLDGVCGGERVKLYHDLRVAKERGERVPGGPVFDFL